MCKSRTLYEIKQHAVVRTNCAHVSFSQINLVDLQVSFYLIENYSTYHEIKRM